MHPRTRVSTVAATLALGLLAACGPNSGDDDPVTSTPSPGEPSASSTGPTEDLSRPADPKARRVRVEGTVSEGVESGCLLLASGGSVYQLLGARPEVGTRVEVVGTIEPDTLTTCQQGLPLRVERLTEL